jgi:3-hydroxyisobutyrate dehydrogenase-like beta-hydroxyacid dehydrogenase
MKLGFIGLGRMGSAMAANLLAAGHELTVYNRTKAKAEPLLKRGAHLAETLGDAARGEVVITMLADDHAVDEAVFGDDGILVALSPGAIHFSMSTISVAESERLPEPIKKSVRSSSQRLCSGVRTPRHRPSCSSCWREDVKRS